MCIRLVKRRANVRAPSSPLTPGASSRIACLGPVLPAMASLARMFVFPVNLATLSPCIVASLMFPSDMAWSLHSELIFALHSF